MRLNRLFGVLVLSASVCGAWAESPAATNPAVASYTLSAVKSAPLSPTTIMYQAVHMTAKETGSTKSMTDFMQSTVSKMYVKLNAAHVAAIGGPIFIYPHGASQGETIDVEIGIPVAEKTAALEGFEVKVLESKPTASAVFRGPFQALGKAFPEFFQQMQQNGMIPAGELRERSLFYDGETSSNNVLLIEMQVAE